MAAVTFYPGLMTRSSGKAAFPKSKISTMSYQQGLSANEWRRAHMAQATKSSAEELSQSERMAVRAIAQTLDSASSYAADAMGMVTKEGVGRMLQGLRFYIKTADTLALRILEKNGVNPNVIVESPATVKSIRPPKADISHSFLRPESNVTVRKLLPKDVQHRDDCNKLLHGTECSCDYDERLEDSRFQLALARSGADVADSEEPIEDDDGNMTVPYTDRKMREIYGDPPLNPKQVEMGYDPKTMTFTAESRSDVSQRSCSEVVGRVTKHPGDDE